MQDERCVQRSNIHIPGTRYVIYYPPTPRGAARPNASIAGELVTAFLKGLVIALPSSRDEDGRLLWEIQALLPDGTIIPADSDLDGADPCIQGMFPPFLPTGG